MLRQSEKAPITFVQPKKMKDIFVQISGEGGKKRSVGKNSVDGQRINVSKETHPFRKQQGDSKVWNGERAERR